MYYFIHKASDILQTFSKIWISMIFGYTPGTLNQIQLEVIFQRTQWSLNGGASSAQASDPFSLRLPEIGTVGTVGTPMIS